VKQPIFDPRPTFLARIPDELLEAVGLGVDDSYGEAARHCQEFQTAQAKDLYPYYRRTLIDDRLLAIGKRFGIEARSVLNTIGNCSHVELEHEGIVLTCSAVESGNAVPREAIFREQLASSSQIELFPESNPVIPAHPKLYAILIHNGLSHKTEHPAFLRIAFPDRECKEYIGDAIDLVVRFASLGSRMRPQEIEPKRHGLGLRPKQKEQEAGDDS